MIEIVEALSLFFKDRGWSFVKRRGPFEVALDSGFDLRSTVFVKDDRKISVNVFHDDDPDPSDEPDSDMSVVWHNNGTNIVIFEGEFHDPNFFTELDKNLVEGFEW